MRVALVSDWYYPKVGGVATHMHNLALKLRELGFRVAVVTNDRPTGREPELEKGGVELVKVPGVISPVLDVNLSFSLRSSRELTGFLDGFDMVHSHHAFTPLSLKAVKAGKELGRVSVLTTHSISLNHDSRLWRAAGLTLPILSSYLRYPDAIIAVSRAAETFIRHFTDVKTFVIPNGVDVRRFHPASNKEDVKDKYGLANRRVVLYVGRMSYRKGPHVLLNAFSYIKDPTAVLVMVGDGGMLSALKLRAKLLGLEGRVVFMGYVPDERLPEVYRMADVSVLPSVAAEAFGMVVLEAMASGVPVVATSVGGMPEIVREDGVGVLVQPGDEVELARAIAALLEDEELRERYGRRGRAVAERKYSWDTVARQVARVYELVQGAPAGSFPARVPGG